AARGAVRPGARGDAGARGCARRGALWAHDRYQLGERAKRIVFNGEQTVGLFPTLFFETGSGLNGGARFIYRELFGDGKLSARAG
ncbi:MAG: hypothetical protein D6689_04775, partial [Deltaproteobacteria bacterium]